MDSRFSVAGLYSVFTGNIVGNATTLPTTTSDTAEVIKALALLISALGALLLTWNQVRGAKPKSDAGGDSSSLKSLLLALVCVSLAVASVGCKLSPSKRLAVATETYTQALNIASAAREAGWMTDATYKRVESVRRVAAAAIDAAPRDAKSPSNELIATIEAAVRELAAAVQEAHDARDPASPAPGHQRIRDSRPAASGNPPAVRGGQSRPDARGVGGDQRPSPGGRVSVGFTRPQVVVV